MEHHSDEVAPPPTARIGPKDRPTNRSTPWHSHRALKATPSSTARISWGRVVCSDRLWNPARAARLSTGDRSPANHGVKMTPPLPGSASAARAVSRSKESMASPSARQCCSQASAPPPESWLLATRLRPGRMPGTVAIWRIRIGLLSREGTAEPAGRGDGQVRLIGEDGAGSGGCRVEVRGPGDHGDPWFEPEIHRPLQGAPSPTTLPVGRSGGSFPSGTPEARMSTGS